MHSLLKRLERLEAHYNATLCGCPPIIVLTEPNHAPLTDAQVEERVVALSCCQVHETYAGLVVRIRRFSEAVHA